MGIMHISAWSIGDRNCNDPLTDLLTCQLSYQSLLVARVVLACPQEDPCRC